LEISDIRLPIGPEVLKITSGWDFAQPISPKAIQLDQSALKCKFGICQMVIHAIGKSSPGQKEQDLAWLKYG